MMLLSTSTLRSCDRAGQDLDRKGGGIQVCGIVELPRTEPVC